jgi:hypothetical protein
MKKLYLSLILLGLLLAGCTPTITKEEFAPNMYKNHPVSILVLPPINNSTAAEAKEYYLTTVTEPLAEAGYYVYPIEMVSEILKEEGLFDTETMRNVPMSKFKDFFGADAVLFVKIEEWNTSYFITSGSVTVKLACELKSTTNGETLWFYDDKVTVNTSASSGGGGGLGLLFQVVATAIQTATQDYVPIARQVNQNIMLAMPAGKYNSNFNQDMLTKIAKKQKEK